MSLFILTVALSLTGLIDDIVNPTSFRFLNTTTAKSALDLDMLTMHDSEDEMYPVAVKMTPTTFVKSLKL